MEILKKFPVSYRLFLEFKSEEPDLEKRFLQFFKCHHLSVSVKVAESIIPHRTGTFTATVLIKNSEHLKKLGRKTRRLNYPAHSTKERALIKGLSKAFEIIECLETGKKLPHKTRRF